MQLATPCNESLPTGRLHTFFRKSFQHAMTTARVRELIRLELFNACGLYCCNAMVWEEEICLRRCLDEFQFLNERPRTHPMRTNDPSKSSGKSKWGLSKWGLNVLVHKRPRLPTIVAILRRKFPLERGPKWPQKCTIVDDCT